MVVSTESSGPPKTRKKRPTGSKSRRSSSSCSAASDVANNQQDAYLYDQPRNVAESLHEVSEEDHLYDVVKPRGEPVGDNTYQNIDSRAVYQNMDDIYDKPVRKGKSKKASLMVQSHYQNVTFDDHDVHAIDEEDEDHTYLNIRTYDIPRSATNIYDQPRVGGGNNLNHVNNNNNLPVDSDYDYPKGLIPLSARLLLNASRKHNYDADSLDGDQSPDIDDGLTELRSGSSPDEGIGTELDSPKESGLGVITEEEQDEAQEVLGLVESPEENCYSNITVIQPRKKKSRNKSTSKNKAPREPTVVDEAVPLQQINDIIPVKEGDPVAQEERIQKDRCIEVYCETLRQRNSHKATKANVRELVSVQSSKDHNMDYNSTIRRMKKFLPSVKVLRNQFESKNTMLQSDVKLKQGRAAVKLNESIKDPAASVRKWKSTSNFHHQDSASSTEAERSRSSSLGSLDEITSTTSSASSSGQASSGSSSSGNHSSASMLEHLPKKDHSSSVISLIQPIIPIDVNDKEKDYDMYRPRHSTAQWNPTSLLDDLYRIQQLISDEANGNDHPAAVAIEGALDKLPSGRRKATFWNAWKRRFFQAKDGYLYCHQNSQSEKPNIVFQLVGGQVEIDNNMISIDDGKGHYMVVRGSSKTEADRWYQALLSHVNYKGNSLLHAYVRPQPIPKEPKLFKDIVILDLGSSSVRAGILSAHATLPQVFFPSVAAVDKTSGHYVAFGQQAVLPEVRANSTLAHPLRSQKISKFMLDMEGVAGLIRTAFMQLNIEPSSYGIQVSVPKHLNHATQAELVRLLFDDFGLQSVNLTHQSVLSMLSYNSTSGIVVDIGDRIDIVPIMDGYMLEASASQVPYGGQQLVDHLRHFLVQQRCSLFTDVESYLIRHVLEKLAYVAGPDTSAYNTELNKAKNDPSTVRDSVDLKPFSNGQLPWEEVSLELGRFQVTEGLFHPEAWGLDNPGIQKLVHKAIQDCSVDIRKEMVRSIFLSGGVTLLPNFPERLEAEIDRITPSHLIPKVHASPYRYHAAFLGACVLSNSTTYEQSKISRDEWRTNGAETVRKWKP